MADYDRAELQRLQTEAAARIREMHARAQPTTASAPAPAESSRRRQADDGLPPMPSFVQVPYNHQDNRQQEQRNERRFEPMPERSGQQTRRNPPTPPQHGGGGRSGGSSPPPERSDSAQRQERSSPGPRRTGMDLMQMLNFKNIDLDGDRTLILLIILLLSGEENDQFLTMALLYLLM